jgi:fibrillarin-like rRNA methylase
LIRLGPYDKETARSMKTLESFEIEKPSIHDIEYTEHWRQLIENVDLVHLAVADMDKTRNIAPQTEQGVQIDGRLDLVVRMRPW